MPSPSIDQLKRAIEISEELERLQAELTSLLGGNEVAAVKPPQLAPSATKGKGKKRGMTPEGRARIAAAQKARWAKARSAK